MEKLYLNSVGRAEELINEAINDSGITDLMRVEYLYNLVDGLLSEENKGAINGSADDFHNFSVTIIRLANDYETALEIVQNGLGIHATNTDLLADAIRYGYNCGKYVNCEEWYRILEKISKKLWTWRAFSFSIDYLLDKLSSLTDSTEANVDTEINYIIELTKEYQKYMPNEEDGRISEYEIYNETNQKEKAMNVLKTANGELKYCPRCWLRYADILMEKGNYEEAEPIIRKLRTKPITASEVNFSYVYYLDGLCKLSRMLDEDDYQEENIKKIYKVFKNALNHPSLNQRIKNKVIDEIKILELESEIKCPFEY